MTARKKSAKKKTTKKKSSRKKATKARVPSLENLGEPACFLLRWLLSLEGEKLYTYFAALVLQAPPFDLEEKADQVVQALVKDGWAERDEDGDGDAYLLATDAARDQLDALFEEFAQSPPAALEGLPVGIMAVALISYALFGYGHRLIENWPSQPDHDELIGIADSLRDKGLLIEIEDPSDETWYLARSPYAWFHREKILEWARAAHPGLREKLMAQLLERLELEPNTPLVHALKAIDRVHFVPDEHRWLAYCNTPLPILEGDSVRTMTTSQPLVIAHILKALELKPGNRVLVCGTKSGILATLAAHIIGSEGQVVCLDDREDVVAYARGRIDRYPKLAGRVTVHRRPDVTVGDEDGAPWDAVLVHGALAKIPRDILPQMNDGGRLLFFLHDPEEDYQRCYLVRKTEEAIPEVLKNEELSNLKFSPIYGRFGFDDPSTFKVISPDQGRVLVDKINSDLPYPLAQSFLKAYNAGDALEQHKLVLRAYETLMKYLTAPLLTANQPSEGETLQIYSKHLHSLAGKPALGHWLAALRELSGVAGLEGTAGRITALIREKHTHQSVLASLELFAERVPGTKASRGADLCGFLAGVVAYRNRSGEGHGNVEGRRDLEKASSVLVSALAYFLTSIPWLQDHRLVAIERVNRTRQGDRVQALELRGVGPRRVRPAECQGWIQNGEQLSPGMMIFEKGNAHTDLYPWMIWNEGEHGDNDVFLFNGRARSGEPEYRSAHSPNRFPPSEERLHFEDLMKRFPRVKTPMDPEAAKQTFEVLLDHFMKDGMLDDTEMAQLCGTLVNGGIESDEEAAAISVRKAAKARNPAVTFPKDWL